MHLYQLNASITFFKRKNLKKLNFIWEFIMEKICIFLHYMDAYFAFRGISPRKGFLMYPFKIKFLLIHYFLRSFEFNNFYSKSDSQFENQFFVRETNDKLSNRSQNIF